MKHTNHVKNTFAEKQKKRKKRYLFFISLAILILIFLGIFLEKESSPKLFNGILYFSVLMIGTNLGALIGEYLPNMKEPKKILDCQTQEEKRQR